MGCLKLTYKREKSKSFFLIHTDEGVVNVTGITYAYEYFLKDHLGNTRVVVKSDGTIGQISDYYPFGMISNTTSFGSTNKYLYNGKELQDELGLELYDYSELAHLVQSILEIAFHWGALVLLVIRFQIHLHMSQEI